MEYRDYESNARDCVREFYRLNHARQTVAFVRAAREKYLPPRTRQMGIWTAMEHLNELVDDSDPDIELPQIAHAVQTAEVIRADGHPDWFILTGLIHDMGKVLCLFGEPQWAVTGDTFPVGCRYSPKVVYDEFFEQNPDWQNPAYQTECGIYEAGFDYMAYTSWLREKKWGALPGRPSEAELAEIAGDPQHPVRRWIKAPLVDLTISFGLVIAFSAVFVASGAMILRPHEVVPKKTCSICKHGLSLASTRCCCRCTSRARCSQCSAPCMGRLKSPAASPTRSSVRSYTTGRRRKRAS